MSIANPSFEDILAVGAEGLPSDWTPTAVATAESVASYDDASGSAFETPYEAFEGGWDGNEAYIFALSDPIDLGEVTPAIYDNVAPLVDVEGVEDFEEGWSSNQAYLFVWGSGGVASYDANTLTESDPETYAVAIGDTLSATSNTGGPAASDPVAGTKAYHQAANLSVGPPIGFDAGGETVRVHYNGRGSFLVTLTDTDLDVSDVSIAINAAAALAGVGGELTAGIINSGGFHLFVTSDLEGSDSAIAIENVSHSDTWERIGYDSSQVGTSNGATGTGNVGLVDAVTAQEIVDLLNGSAAILAIGLAATVSADARVRLHAPIAGWVMVNASALATALGFTTAVQFGPSTLAADTDEDFEEGWDGNEAYDFDWADIVAGLGDDAATYDSAGTPEDVEDFEERWDSNQSYQFTMGSTTAASYDTGTGGTPEAVEDFEEVKAPFAVSANPATDRLAAVAHGLSDGQTFTIENDGGQLPAGLFVGFTYYVVNSTANDFQVATSSGGSAVDITDAGVGTHTVTADPAVFWTEIMATL